MQNRKGSKRRQMVAESSSEEANDKSEDHDMLEGITAEVEGLIKEQMQEEPSKETEKEDVNEMSMTSQGMVRRKVRKTRTTMDTKGYMVTEDYDSFEEVSAEEFAKDQAAKKIFS